MNLKTTLGVGLLMLCEQAAAVPGNLAGGTQISTGSVSLPNAAISAAHNPALLSRALGDAKLGMSGFRLPAIAVEIGPIDDFVDSLERLEAALDEAEADNHVSQAEADDINNQFAQLLVDIGDQANITLDLSMPVPAMPVIFRAGGGLMAVNLDLSATINARVLDAPLNYDAVADTLDTDSAVYLKSGTFTQLGVAYSRTLAPWTVGETTGEWTGGGRLNVIQGKLSRQVAKLDNDGHGSDDSAFDRAGDNYDLNEETSIGVGVDVGLGFVSRQLSLGLTVRNLIPPTFDFGELGMDCASKPTVTERIDCDAASVFVTSAEIGAREKFSMDTQAMFEAAYSIADTGFTALASLDLNAIENAAGDDYQWLHLGFSYQGPRWVPGLRLGYRSNLAGAKVDVLAVGLNLFNFLSLEAFQASDRVRYEGDSLPRSAGVSIGFSARF